MKISVAGTEYVGLSIATLSSQNHEVMSVRRIDENGNELENFDIKEPSGIANDSRSNTLWILTNKYLYNCSYDGVVQKNQGTYKRTRSIVFRRKKDLIYFSAGAD